MLNNHIILGNTTQLAGEVEIEDYAIISGGTLAHQLENWRTRDDSGRI